jgi:hypothetical protein
MHSYSMAVSTPTAIIPARNHGLGRACVGLRPKDLALIGLKPRGVAPKCCAFLEPGQGQIQWSAYGVLDGNDMLSCNPVCSCHVGSLITWIRSLHRTSTTISRSVNLLVHGIFAVARAVVLHPE